ncbi:hypothetical protein CJ217_08345 [Streptococcus sp. UMB1385]|nr:hypothetical protein CJ217_08345 [Streptococcus sp. UMB1385]
MIDQRYRKVSFGTAVSDFFKGSVDYSGFTSRAGHWFPVGLIYLIFAGVYTGIFASVYKKYNSIGFFKNVIGFSDAAELYLRSNSEFASLLYIITGVFVLLHIPIAASFCRRLRDVGFTTLFSAILIALYVILAYFYVALITPVYVIVFFFILMSLPANKVETNNNDEFSKFVFRQSFQAQQYYAQFNNQQFDQFGNPIPNQQNFNNEMNQGFNPQGQPGFNPNAPHGHQNPGFQGQPQQGFNPQGQPGFNPNAPQGRPNPGFQGQPQQGFNPQGQQGFNPNGSQGRPNPGFQGQPQQGFNPQGQQGFNPNAPQGRPNPGFQGQPQGFHPQRQPQQNVNPNAPQGGQNQGFNDAGAQAQQAPEVKQEEVVVEQQNVEVAPQVEVTPTVEEVQVETAPTVEEVAPEVEATQEVKIEVAGGARSRRLQKLNKAEEEAVFKKRR